MIKQNVSQEEMMAVVREMIDQGFSRGNYAALDAILPETF